MYVLLSSQAAIAVTPRKLNALCSPQGKREDLFDHSASGKMIVLLEVMLHAKSTANDRFGERRYAIEGSRRPCYVSLAQPSAFSSAESDCHGALWQC